MQTRAKNSMHALVVCAVVGVLSLLVGLVASSGRRVAPPRPPVSPESFAPAEPREPELVAAPTIPPAEPEPVQPASATAGSLRQTPVKRAEFARLTGIVYRPEGEPAPLARVVLGKQSARCDHEGRFDLVLTIAPSGADLCAFEPGFEPALRPSFGSGLAEGFQGEVRLVLGPPTLQIQGRVVDFAGSPVKGWTIELDERDPLRDLGLRERVRTDSDGTFTLGDVPRGAHVLRAFKQEASLAVRSDSVDAGTTGVTITVDE